MHAGLHTRQACALERPARVAALHVPLRRSHGAVEVCDGWAIMDIWELADSYAHMFDFFSKLERSCAILTTVRGRSRPRAQESRRNPRTAAANSLHGNMNL